MSLTFLLVVVLSGQVFDLLRGFLTVTSTNRRLDHMAYCIENLDESVGRNCPRPT